MRLMDPIAEGWKGMEGWMKGDKEKGEKEEGEMRVERERKNG